MDDSTNNYPVTNYSGQSCRWNLSFRGKRFEFDEIGRKRLRKLEDEQQVSFRTRITKRSPESVELRQNEGSLAGMGVNWQALMNQWAVTYGNPILPLPTPNNVFSPSPFSYELSHNLSVGGIAGSIPSSFDVSLWNNDIWKELQDVISKNRQTAPSLSSDQNRQNNASVQGPGGNQVDRAQKSRKWLPYVAHEIGQSRAEPDFSTPPPELHVDKLSRDILRYFNRKRQSDELYRRKFALRDALYAIISQHLFPKCGLYIVGSSMNGLGTFFSDMDLCLMITNDEICQKTHAVEILRQIADLLERDCSGWDIQGQLRVRSQQLILAKVPILRIQFDPPFQDIQIDLNANNSVAIKNTHLLYYYTQCDWRLCPLVVAVKEWAKRNEINDASKSTLSSYSLVLMVIHYLQAGVTPPVLPILQKLYPDKFSAEVDPRKLNIWEPLSQMGSTSFVSKNYVSLGDLFIGFLRYYSVEFDFTTDAVSVREGRKLSRSEVLGSLWHLHNPQQWRFICIEEPFSLANTAHAVYDDEAFDAVKECLKRSYNTLKATRDLRAIMENLSGLNQKQEITKNQHVGWTNISYQDLCTGMSEMFNQSVGVESVDSGCGSDTGFLRYSPISD